MSEEAIREVDMGEVYSIDAIDFLGLLPSNSIDLFITDPPYYSPALTSGGTRDKPYRKSLADMSVLEHFFQTVFSALEKPLKDSGTAYVFCDSQSYPILFRAMLPYFKNVRALVWDRITSYNGYTWRRGYELIAWGEGDEVKRIPTGDSDILRYRAVRQADRVHPAEKPIDLVRTLIRKHINAEVICDPFVGSGTTVLAAMLEGRKWYASDLDPKWANVSTNRIFPNAIIGEAGR